MAKILFHCFFLLFLWACGPVHDNAPLGSNVGLDQEPPKVKVINYENDIKPILENRCLQCHNKQTLAGGIRLDGYPFLFIQKSHPDPAPPHNKMVDLVLPGDKAQSGLFLSVVSEEDNFHEVIIEGTMPKDEKLSSIDIETIGKWIDEGALEKGL